MEIAGGCLCGGTRYVLKVAPFSLVDCHCHDCRRSCGAPCVTWGSVRRADLIIGGREPRKVAHAGRIRSFAACCGTHLFFEESSDSETIDVTIASLDDPAPFAPQKVIWLEDKLPWVVIDQSLPSFPRSSAEGESKKNKTEKVKRFFNDTARYVAFKKRSDRKWEESDLRAVLMQIGPFSNWTSKPGSDFFDYAEKSGGKIVAEATGWQSPKRHYAFAFVATLDGEIGILPDKSALDQKFPT